MKRLALCALAGLFMLTGCKAEIKGHALLIGDSLTDQSQVEINHELAWVTDTDPQSPFLVTIDTIPGAGARTVPSVSDPAAFWNARLASVVEHVDPEAYIIELGTNDCTHGVGDDYGTAIDFFLSRLPESKPVFWLTIPDRTERDALCVAAANQAIMDAPARWSNLTAWDLHAAISPDDANYQPGWVHLSDQGTKVYAQLLHDGLETAFGSTPDTTTTTTTTTTAAP